MKTYLRRLWAAVKGRDYEQECVRRLHQKFDMLNFTEPGHLHKAKLRERVTCLLEEVEEFSEASKAQDLVAQIDALVDLVYYAKGTAVMLGIRWDQHWDAVHGANMKKVRGVGKRGHPVDLIKPAGWVPPERVHQQIIARQGYEAPPSAWEADLKGRHDA